MDKGATPGRLDATFTIILFIVSVGYTTLEKNAITFEGGLEILERHLSLLVAKRGRRIGAGLAIARVDPCKPELSLSRA
jgi:hypothetical protein